MYNIAYQLADGRCYYYGPRGFTTESKQKAIKFYSLDMATERLSDIIRARLNSQATPFIERIDNA